MPDQLFSPDSFQTFGDLLRYLRRRERLTQLELSIMVGYSEAQMTRLEKNQRRPDLTALKALFIPALHIENEPEVIARLLELAQLAPQQAVPAPGISPYKGLLFFDESDAELFFGREILTAHLVDRVSKLAIDSPLRFVAVVGASGSGKSSLVRAGLATTLKRDGWDVRTFTPGTNPTKALDMQLEPDQEISKTYRLLLLVDQFEEAFTLCHDEAERVNFIERLLKLAQEPIRKTTIMIALRADFYSHCAQYPLLRQAVAAEQEYIGQMNREELKRAIEEPAKRGGWEFEAGLVDLLLNEIGAQGTGQPEPGALPLLSHALLATWERRRGRLLTSEGYRTSGGVRGAIAETAESVFTDQLNQTQQEIARDVFLRLTELGEGTEDTRRRAALNELVRQSTEATQLHAVLNTLAEARLVTLNENTAEVAHEALIREWQRLHEWLIQDRDGLLLHRHLTESAYEWEVRRRDSAELYRGVRLAQAREWASTNEKRLNALERDFLTASIKQEQQDVLDREAQRQRELEAAQKLAETERARAEEQAHSADRLRMRNRIITTIGSIAIILALVAGIFGAQSNQNAIAAHNNAATAQVAKENAFRAQGTAQAASTQAIADFTRSEAQRLAAEANSLLLSHGDSNLTALLAIRSLNMQYTPAGDALLGNPTSLPAPPQEFKGHTADLWGVAFSPDGKYLATGSSDHTARLWDVATGQTVRTFTGHTGEVGQVAFSPDGKYLLTASLDLTVRMWDVATGQTMQIFSGHTGGVDVVALSADGKYLVTNGAKDNTARIWDVATGRTLHVLIGHTAEVVRATIAPDGKTAVSTGLDGTTRVWDAVTGSQARILDQPWCVGAVAYSHDSQYIATPCDDGVIRLWEIATGELADEFAYPGGVFVAGIKFSPDDHFLLTGSEDRTARLWDVATGQIVRTFGGHGNVVQDVAFSPDGSRIATAGNDGIARVWKLETFPGGAQFTVSPGALQASFSPNGKQIVVAVQDGTAPIFDTATGQTVVNLRGQVGTEMRGAVFSPNGKQVLVASSDGTASLWDARTGGELQRFEGHTDVVNRAIFSPDGKYIITTSYDGTARVWDVQTARTLATYTDQGEGHVNRVAFSPDGTIVATSGDNGTVHTWDPFTGKDIMSFKGHTDDVRGIAFSPDGKYMVTASIDGSVRLWEVATGKEVHRFPGHPGGASGAAFSPDGKYVVSSGLDGTARMWDIHTGQEVRRFAGVDGSVTFSPDGMYLLTTNSDGSVRLWLVNIHDTIRAVCALLTRDLTSDERIEFGISDLGPTCPTH